MFFHRDVAEQLVSCGLYDWIIQVVALRHGGVGRCRSFAYNSYILFSNLSCDLISH